MTDKTDGPYSWQHFNDSIMIGVRSGDEVSAFCWLFCKEDGEYAALLGNTAYAAGFEKGRLEEIATCTMIGGGHNTLIPDGIAVVEAIRSSRASGFNEGRVSRDGLREAVKAYIKHQEWLGYGDGLGVLSEALAKDDEAGVRK